MTTQLNDVQQIRALLQASYAAISGPAGRRDWEAHARYFIPEGRSHVVHSGDGSDRVETMTEAQYRDSRDPFFRTHSFWETETRCDVIVEGDLAVAMSHYESRWAESEPPFETGVNSVQLARLDGEWKIVSIMWTAGVAAERVDELR
ncbi:MAG TPA: hypothetical protein VFO55_04990 [Gemmatimonadaceae bacterium]|nr:hypothetical protein [Gemmatimonadaceae bacterium]